MINTKASPSGLHQDAACAAKLFDALLVNLKQLSLANWKVEKAEEESPALVRKGTIKSISIRIVSVQHKRGIFSVLTHAFEPVITVGPLFEKVTPRHVNLELLVDGVRVTDPDDMKNLPDNLKKDISKIFAMVQEVFPGFTKPRT